MRGRKPFNAVAATFRKFALSDGFRLVHFSVQHDHFHFLIEADSKPRLSAAMQKLCISIARRLNHLWGEGKTWIGRIFKQRYHAHLLKTPTEVRNAIVYVLANAAKHGELQPGHADPFSSALAFDGYQDQPRVTSPPLFDNLKDLGTARTELLAAKWQIRGLIDLEKHRGRCKRLDAKTNFENRIRATTKSRDTKMPKRVRSTETDPKCRSPSALREAQ